MTVFKKKMKSDISEIKSSPNVFIFADKTSNIYKAAPREYNKLLKDNITNLKRKRRTVQKKQLIWRRKTSQKKFN